MSHEDERELFAVQRFAYTVAEGENVIDQTLPSVFVRDEAEFAFVIDGVTVTEVVVAENDIAVFSHFTHKTVKSADILGHAVDNVEQSLGTAVGNIDFPLEFVLFVG